ncbi:MAG: hypothetical protein IPI83_14840 [Sphingomonadales bacterium]|nr:hypothetical protein [Sphingomonadales bacterium]
MPDSLEIIVRPDNSDNWRGSEIGKAIVATSARLEAAGFHNVEIIAPSTAKGTTRLNISATSSAFRALWRICTCQPIIAMTACQMPWTSTPSERPAAARTWQPAMLEYVDGGVGDLLADLGEADAASRQKTGIAARQRTDGTASPGWLIVTHRSRRAAETAPHPNCGPSG